MFFLFQAFIIWFKKEGAFMTAWWKKSSVYQIYPRSFQDSNGDGIGDLQGIMQRLPYLEKLGIDIIWLGPIYDSPNDDNGYDIRDYQKIQKEFGSLDDFKQLVTAAKAHGIGIMMDLVVNHTSDEHQWFEEARSSRTSKYRDYYIFKEQPNNWGSFFSGSAWTYNEPTDDYYLHLFSTKQPDLNWENSEMRQVIYDMMKSWLKLGIVGFRMDVINLIAKDERFPDGEKQDGELYGDGSPYYMNLPKVHDYLKEMYKEVLADGDYVTVGETPGTMPESASVFTNPHDKELSMIFTFEHMDVDSEGPKWHHKPLDLVALKQIFERWQRELHGTGWNSLYWNNHDQPRVVSRFGQDGKYRVQSAKMLAIALHLMQGTPYIYQGEEIGMTNVDFQSIDEYRDIETLNYYEEQLANGKTAELTLQDIARKSRDHARTPMQWDETGGFTTGTPWIRMNDNVTQINVKAALADPNSIFYTYQQLIQLRKNEHIVQHGTFELLLKEHPQLFVYKRQDEQRTWLVIANFSEQTFAQNFATVDVTQLTKAIITNGGVRIDGEIIHIEPYGAAVFEV